MTTLDQLLDELKGQSEIVTQVKALISDKLDNPDRQINMHFAGDNGVGKTWLARKISIALSRNSSAMWTDAGGIFFQIDLHHGQLPENSSIELILKATEHIREQISNAVHLCPNAVVVVDELETLHPKVVSGLTSALKGEPVGGHPTKRATFILTSDFGKYALLLHIRTYIHTYIHTHIHTYIRTYIHTYIHT
jgi:MoxR-like ATPase